MSGRRRPNTPGGKGKDAARAEKQARTPMQVLRNGLLPKLRMVIDEATELGRPWRGVRDAFTALEAVAKLLGNKTAAESKRMSASARFFRLLSTLRKFADAVIAQMQSKQQRRIKWKPTADVPYAADVSREDEQAQLVMQTLAYLLQLHEAGSGAATSDILRDVERLISLYHKQVMLILPDTKADHVVIWNDCFGLMAQSLVLISNIGYVASAFHDSLARAPTTLRWHEALQPVGPRPSSTQSSDRARVSAYRGKLDSKPAIVKRHHLQQEHVLAYKQLVMQYWCISHPFLNVMRGACFETVANTKRNTDDIVAYGYLVWEQQPMSLWHLTNDLLDTGTPTDWSLSTQLRVMRQLAEVLHFLNVSGVIACRIAASNILLTASLDLRLADYFPPSEPADRIHDGYAAPELFMGGTATTSADVFSWGAIAHEIVSGTAPTPATRQPLDPRAVPIPVRHLIETALAKDPSRRPSWTDVLTKLDAISSGKVELVTGSETLSRATSVLLPSHSQLGGFNNSSGPARATGINAPTRSESSASILVAARRFRQLNNDDSNRLARSSSSRLTRALTSGIPATHVSRVESRMRVASRSTASLAMQHQSAVPYTASTSSSSSSVIPGATLAQASNHALSRIGSGGAGGRIDSGIQASASMASIPDRDLSSLLIRRLDTCCDDEQRDQALETLRRLHPLAASLARRARMLDEAVLRHVIRSLTLWNSDADVVSAALTVLSMLLSAQELLTLGDPVVINATRLAHRALDECSDSLDAITAALDVLGTTASYDHTADVFTDLGITATTFQLMQLHSQRADLLAKAVRLLACLSSTHSSCKDAILSPTARKVVLAALDRFPSHHELGLWARPFRILHIPQQEGVDKYHGDQHETSDETPRNYASVA